MLFNSLEFFVFFLIVFVTYFLVKHKYRWAVLLIASCYFYMQWNYKYIVLIGFTTVASYIAAILIQTEEDIKLRKLYLGLNIVASLGILVVYKYFNFFNDSLRVIFERLNMNYSISALELLLPMGISFYTFQTLSYSIDVYRKDIKAEKHLGKYALYISFFPQLVAGPIERATSLLPQFYKKHIFEYDDFVEGLQLTFWGLFKKVVIADQVSVMVSMVYDNIAKYQGLHLIIATILFAIQIYCDFSGYSDMAIGIAKTMGFDLTKNFKQPYLSKSVTEFWKRWHISLSSWFQDYLYIPLGGSRVSFFRHAMNLIITFLISGLWHGASWNFVIWGLIHGCYLVIELMLRKISKLVSFGEDEDKHILFKCALSVFALIRRIVSICFVVFAWIFFRANSISDAKYIVKNLFVGVSSNMGFEEIRNVIFNLGLAEIEVRVVSFSILLLIIYDLMDSRYGIKKVIARIPLPIRWMLYYAVIITVLLFRNVELQEFIYFQF